MPNVNYCFVSCHVRGASWVVVLPTLLDAIQQTLLLSPLNRTFDVCVIREYTDSAYLNLCQRLLTATARDAG